MGKISEFASSYRLSPHAGSLPNTELTEDALEHVFRRDGSGDFAQSVQSGAEVQGHEFP